MRITDIKFCSGCQSHKPRDEFYRNAFMKDGLNCYCKVCAKAASARSRRKWTQMRKALWGHA